MSIFNQLFGKSNSQSSRTMAGAIDYGKTKKDGSHSHIFNRGGDQTPAQKKGHEQSSKTKAENKASK